MQTFLPYPSYTESAACLDYRRLGKQRVEAKQLVYTLFYGGGWANHPAAKMWKGHVLSLCEYGLACCTEWRSRGYKDTLQSWFADILCNNIHVISTHPSWLGDPKFHRSHQSNLLRKLPDHYSRFNWGVPDHLPYVWPVPAAGR